MKMKANSGGGAGGTFEVPPDDNHKAAVVAVIDLGTQMEGFGVEPVKPVRKVLVAFELLDERKADGERHIVAEQYRLSLHEKAKLREVVEAACGKLSDGAEFEFKDMLGKAVRLTITHETKGDKVYANTSAITAADKKDRGAAKTEAVPFLYSMESGEEYVPHDYIPWTYHRGAGKRLSPEAIIAQSQEKAGKAQQGQQAQRQAATAGAV